MNTLTFITITAFFIWIVRNTFFWVSLWQRKEYRFDRIRIHLFETGQGRKMFTSFLSLLKWVAILSYGLVIFRPNFLIPFQICVAAIYIVQAIFVFQEILLRTLQRPVLTMKALFLILAAFTITAIFYVVPLVDFYLWVVILDRLMPFVVACLVFLLSFPTELYQDYRIEQAVKKLQKHPNVLVIGVTGSYGKSSAKEYIAQILSKKFNVLKTQGTNNTPIGLANTILTGLNEKTYIFVAEMGAYKQGEIAEMCEMVHPKIGILTAVNDQHLALFGSIENTMQAKYELIESLPKDGFAIFNGNNKNAYKLYTKTKKRKVLTMCISDQATKNIQKFYTGAKSDLVYAQNVVTKKDGVYFDVVLGGKIIHMETPLIGIQNVENILPAIYIAKNLGVKTSLVKQAVATLFPLEKTMRTKRLSSGALIIDDTYNTNPDAVLAVLEYMKIYKKKKIFIFEPMIELGERSETQHYRVAREIANVCDAVFLTNKNFYKQIVAGVSDGQKDCKVLVARPAAIATYIQKHAKKDDIIAFEGRQSGFALSLVS